MNTRSSLYSRLLLPIALLLAGQALAQNANRFVSVGDLKNPPDVEQNGIQFGSVATSYLIGKYKVTVTEYSAFLNSKAASDPNGLFNELMEITRAGEEGAYTYTVAEGKADRPIRYVEPLDCMRYCNWLNNGATRKSDTEKGTYDLTDPAAPGARNKNALVFLPTENEWYKAAYYDPQKAGGGGYWLFAVRSDEVLSGLPPGGKNSANFDSVNTDDGGTTDVGAYLNSKSYYGTYDQVGNTWEWLEPDPLVDPAISRRRSGSWANAIGRLDNTQTGQGPVTEGGTEHQGFRIARSDVFPPRNPPPAPDIEVVTVGNPGNPADVSQADLQFGAVADTYRIGKFEVTVAQYAAFLNAKAATDPNELFNENMEIIRDGDDGRYTYKVEAGKANRPIRFIEPLNGFRFCNWLHNGGLNGDTETGAYKFTDPLTPGARTPGARFFLPTENEWYKAAYYDPTKGSGGYWMFATRSDEVVSGLPSGGQNSANFDSVNTADGGTTDAGAYVNSKSYYGTFDQTGNVWEWLEPDPTAPETSVRRSGSWANAVGRLDKTQTGNGPLNEGATEHQGFRIAGIVAAANPPQVAIRLAAGKIEVTWTGQHLETATSVPGQWSILDNAPNPLLVVPNDKARFYRSAR
ncbi:MAG: SUMF1/EgtB/PvdO family nonheme iron enzyme [Verrucomicrobiota bacterium]